MNLTCEELRELLADYTGGDLVVDRQESFDSHLKSCEQCMYYVESYTFTVKVTRKLPRCGPLPTGLEQKLRQVLEEHLKGCEPPKDGQN